jgi:hypothetical protein
MLFGHQTWTQRIENANTQHGHNMAGLYTRGIKKKKGQKTKKQPRQSKKQPTDFPFFGFGFGFCGLGPMRVGCGHGHATACGHPQLAAGCGVFLYELVPSGGPFISCLCETFFCGHFLFFNGHFLFPPKNKLGS